MSKAIKDGGPAYPVADPFFITTPENVDEAQRLAHGMSLRDHYAGLAMQGLLARAFTKDEQGRPFVEWVAEFSHEIADEMLRARSKEPGS